MAFIIDTVGSNENPLEKDEDIEDNAIISKILREYKESLLTDNFDEKPKTVPKSKKQDSDNIVDNFLKEIGWTENGKFKNTDSIKELKAPTNEIKNLLKKSIVLQPEFEKAHTVPPIEVSERKLKLARKKEAEKTKGKKWYGLPATEVTDEIRNDLEVLKMRSVLDPKRFYKKNDLKVIPKYFQVGKVMDSPLDYYNSRLTKKERKKTLVDELMADAEFNKYNKRKYKEIIEDKQKTHYKAWKQAKKLKKNK